jgi:excinuclease ABC subunit B
VNAEVILYADTMTESMNRAIGETNRRRTIQLAYNVEHNITPRTVQSAIKNAIEEEIEARQMAQAAATGGTAAAEDYVTIEYVQELYEEMLEAAKTREFERAIALRDQIVKLEAELKKKYGDAAPPSVLGNKAVPVSQPTGAKKKGKWKKG